MFSKFKDVVYVVLYTNSSTLEVKLSICQIRDLSITSNSNYAFMADDE